MYGVGFHLWEILAVAAVCKSSYRAGVAEITGKSFLLLSRLIRISSDWQLPHQVEMRDGSITCQFSGRVGRYLELAVPRLPKQPLELWS